MQVLEAPRLYHESEDVHLLDTFIISSKPNEANWKVNRQALHKIAQNSVGKDFYAIPERIFKPLAEGRGGHTEEGSFEQEMAEITKNSLGKIISISEPQYYNDGTDDFYYKGKVRLNGSKAASILIENGSKTWIPFAVSPHIWPRDGPDHDILDAEFMGLGLVIKGAYGEQAVVTKYCSGGAVGCNKSLAAAIQDVINSFDTKNDTLNIMSQQATQVSPNNSTNQFLQQPTQVPQVQEIKEQKEKSTDITLTKEEYDTVQKQLKEQEELKSEVTNLRNEYKNNVLGQIFNNITDENVRKTLHEKYFERDVKLVKEVFDDIIAHIVPSKIEEAIKSKEQSSNSTEEKKGSKTGSVLKPEPKADTESKTAAVVNDEPTISQLRRELGL